MDDVAVPLCAEEDNVPNLTTFFSLQARVVKGKRSFQVCCDSRYQLFGLVLVDVGAVYAALTVCLGQNPRHAYATTRYFCE